MSLHDLTPQLRTRLSRIEKSVGWFLGLAVLALVAGFLAYSYHTAKNKGWFKSKALYFTYVRSATGLKVGDSVRLMGLNVGEITLIDPMPAENTTANMYVEFRIWEPYYGYLWTDSRVRVNAGDFLGSRALEVQRGLVGKASYKLGRKSEPVEIWDGKEYKKVNASSKFELPMDESESLSDDLAKMVAMVKGAMPGVLALTNRIEQVLSNSILLTANLNRTVDGLQPTLAHLRLISETLTNGQGSLGQWLIPTNINQRLDTVLSSANTTLVGADKAVGEATKAVDSADQLLVQARVDMHQTVTNLLPMIEHMAGITSNLNAQVQANSNLLAVISGGIQRADELMQGLKKHWLLRSAFKPAITNTSRSKSASSSKGAHGKP